jgi:hypothetical protein
VRRPPSVSSFIARLSLGKATRTYNLTYRGYGFLRRRGRADCTDAAQPGAGAHGAIRWLPLIGGRQFTSQEGCSAGVAQPHAGGRGFAQTRADLSGRFRLAANAPSAWRRQGFARRPTFAEPLPPARRGQRQLLPSRPGRRRVTRTRPPGPRIRRHRPAGNHHRPRACMKPGMREARALLRCDPDGVCPGSLPAPPIGSLVLADVANAAVFAVTLGVS